ncbi:hypothetical protein LCGC14_3083260, partial [marine sediment metagenome]
MKKIYSYNKGRNKLPKGNGVETVKKKLYLQHPYCSFCGEEFFSIRRLQLEHTIPVEIGGHLFEEGNVNLVCIKCHHKKTLIDKETIIIIKKMGYIIKGTDNSLVPLKTLRKLYLQISKEIKKNK